VECCPRRHREGRPERHPMRKCCVCGVQYEPTRSRGYRCPTCCKQYDREWRAKRRLEGRPVVSTRMPRVWEIAYEKQWRERDGVHAQLAENQRRYRNDDGLRPRHIARSDLHHAIESGVISRQPCEVCGLIPAEAHHDDYTKPLEVRWLCRCHHGALHARQRLVATINARAKGEAA
jgi:hypothetical protein